MPDLTALFVSNDLPAIGALQAAADLGLSRAARPVGLSITDIQLASEVRPALTTVAVPTAEAAELAVAALMQMIDDHDIGDGTTARMGVASAPRLMVRGSTARPAKG